MIHLVGLSDKSLFRSYNGISYILSIKKDWCINTNLFERSDQQFIKNSIKIY